MRSPGDFYFGIDIGIHDARKRGSAAWSGAVIAGFGGLTINQYLAIGGFFLAPYGFSVNVLQKTQIVKIECVKFRKELAETDDN